MLRTGLIDLDKVYRSIKQAASPDRNESEMTRKDKWDFVIEQMKDNPTLLLDILPDRSDAS